MLKSLSLFIFLLLSLTSCDGYTPQNKAIIENNKAPVISSKASFDVTENSALNQSVIAIDTDSNTLFYEITTGADQLLFNIDNLNGALSFISPADFENPQDNNVDNIYEITVSITDSLNTVTQNITITVSNLDDNLPSASNLNIDDINAGQLIIGDILNADYQFTDADNDAEGTTLFQWLRNGVDISGETNSNYTLSIADIGEAISFQLTPTSNNGVSGATLNSPEIFTDNATPSASAVSISGDTSGSALLGTTLTGNYSYTDIESDLEGSSQFRWLRDGAEIANANTLTYTTVSADSGTVITFEVTPISLTGSNPGSPQVSTGVNITPLTTTLNLCTTNENGIFNKLGVRRYLRFNITQTQSVTISATKTAGSTNSDPDLYLYKQGVLVASASAVLNNTESLTTNLSAGIHVLEVFEFAYSEGTDSTVETCHDINISYALGSPKPSNTTNTAPPKNTTTPVTFKSGPSSCSSIDEITISGRLTFQRVGHNPNTNGLDYSNTTSQPIKNAVVESICNGDIYDSGTTDINGNYALTASNANNNFIRVKAQMLDSTIPGTWNFQVVDNTSSGALYAMDTSSVTPSGTDISNFDFEAVTGWDGIAYTGTRVAAPFAILDSVFNAFQQVLSIDPNADFPSLNINWSPNNTLTSGDKSLGQIVTSHYDGNAIYILGDDDADTDEFDDFVVKHEWAHYFEDKFSRSDSMGAPHSLGDILDMRIAFGEGFASAYAAIASSTSVYQDASGTSQASGFGFDIDNDNCINPGWYSECSMQSIIYDLQTALPDGFLPLYNVLINEQKNSNALTSIFSFIKPLLDNNADSAAAINALTGAQSINDISDIYGDSELNNNPGNTDQLPIFSRF